MLVFRLFLSIIQMPASVFDKELLRGFYSFICLLVFTERVWGYRRPFSKTWTHSADTEIWWVSIPFHLCCIWYVHHSFCFWALWAYTGTIRMITFSWEIFLNNKLLEYVIKLKLIGQANIIFASFSLNSNSSFFHF